MQLNLSDGLQRKEEGLAKVEGDAEFLAIMRCHAKHLSATAGLVTSDNLRTIAAHNGITPRSSHSWGAIFTGKGWVQIGRTPSRLAGNHGREIRVWRWEGA